MSSFRLLPPRHLVPLWVCFFAALLIAGGFFEVISRVSPASRLRPLPRFRFRLFLLRGRFYLGVVQGSGGVGSVHIRGGIGSGDVA